MGCPIRVERDLVVTRRQPSTRQRTEESSAYGTMAQDLRSRRLRTGDPAFRTRPERQKSVSSQRAVRPQRTPDLDLLDLDRATVRRAGRSPGRREHRSSGWPAPTPRCRSSVRCCVWPGRPRPPGRHPVGQPPGGRRLRDQAGLEHGVALPVWDAMRRTGEKDVTTLAQRAATGGVTFRGPGGEGRGTRSRRASTRAVRRGITAIDRRRTERERLVARIGDAPRKPWIYLIVATGNIYDDVAQAKAAAHAGADIVAVIRSTAQSLLDYVPDGATTEGYAGTYATQENFKLIRGATDDVSKDYGRYIHLTNYASGLCMAEIATLAGLERLDMILNDSMYGILFRDINPCAPSSTSGAPDHCSLGHRDQHGRGQLPDDGGRSGEGAYRPGEPVRERGVREACRRAGRADGPRPCLRESTRAYENSFLLELAQAQLIRQVFPRHPIKWMPPTKFKSGDIFQSHVHDAMFSLVGALTGQGILLVGMIAEAVVTPFLSDRDLALQNVRYVLDAAGRLHEDFHPQPGGFIQTRAHQVLDEAVTLLERIIDEPGKAPLLEAIGDGTFGLMKRPADRGKGYDGVVTQGDGTGTRPPRSWRDASEHPQGADRAIGAWPNRTSHVVGNRPSRAAD